MYANAIWERQGSRCRTVVIQRIFFASQVFGGSTVKDAFNIEALTILAFLVVNHFVSQSQDECFFIVALLGALFLLWLSTLVGQMTWFSAIETLAFVSLFLFFFVLTHEIDFLAKGLRCLSVICDLLSEVANFFRLLEVVGAIRVVPT